MTSAHDLADLIDARLNVGGGAGADSHTQGILLVAVFLVVRAQRQDDPIVQRGAERRAFLFSDADHLARRVVPTNLLADGVDSGHEIFHQVLPDNADGRSVAQVGFRNVPSGYQVDVVELRHLRRPGAQVRVFQRVEPPLRFDAPANPDSHILASLANIPHATKAFL